MAAVVSAENLISALGDNVASQHCATGIGDEAISVHQAAPYQSIKVHLMPRLIRSMREIDSREREWNWYVIG